jgi:Na+-translocating ferredoxin:NAD+ oxidoreductase subunit B
VLTAVVVWVARALSENAKTSAVLLEERINLLLPQTQCGQCGHPGCRPYAKAIAAGEAINRCPPGGAETIVNLSRLLGAPAIPLDISHGEHAPRKLAFIREAECIGCTKCIQACPVDAILGAAKLMHTVIESECTGCDLCVAPCPVDCIDMITAPVTPQNWQWSMPTATRARKAG